MAEYVVVLAAVLAALVFIVRQFYKATVKDGNTCCSKDSASCPSCGNRKSACEGAPIERRGSRIA